MKISVLNALHKISYETKRALETVSVAENEQHHQAVVSSADGCKGIKKLDNLAEKIENLKRSPIKAFCLKRST
ncbi:MAG: hypothetical protein E7073_03480 [Bacteroidales bacterium]|jgi:hypothetical protein|nr:hypothetical protein [Bacteroidales bacterium]